MGRFLLSPRAQKDLDNIWEFSAERWGEDRAESYVRGLWAGICAIADDPRRGHECEVRADYFQFSVGRHILFFKRIDDGVSVIRTLHQSMDFGRHL